MACTSAFDALPPSHRRELIRYIEESKTPETRRRRIEKTAASVLGRVSRTKSALKDRPMWTCPKCGHAFVNKNQYHSCRRYELEDVLGRLEEAVALARSDASTPVDFTSSSSLAANAGYRKSA